jgi:hypothetical protein
MKQRRKNDPPRGSVSSEEQAKAIPALAKSAAANVHAQFQAGLQHALNQVATETLESMGLSPADGWVVDFGRGLAVRRQRPRQG